MNELLIWLHSALMLSASVATDRSISATVGEDQWTGSITQHKRHTEGPHMAFRCQSAIKESMSNRACRIVLSASDWVFQLNLFVSI